jgi:4-hydroxybenzoate polyprenyltransferase
MDEIRSTLTPRPAPTLGNDAGSTPLYVDLDGTLIASDLLWESLVALARRRPLDLLCLPRWLLGGKAAFKACVAKRGSVDVRTLPYRPEVLAYIASQRALGRPVVLATASDRHVVAPLASHLDVFDDVLASDGSSNLSGARKLAAIRSHLAALGRPPEAFEYLGNSLVDLPIWREARFASAAAPSAGVLRRASVLGKDVAIVADARPAWRGVLRALRPHQWVKNSLLFVPLLLAHRVADLDRVASVCVAFACFCAIASASYLINDLLDLEADRQHPSKRLRPMASGQLSIAGGVALSGGLLVAGFAAAWQLLSLGSSVMLGLYLLLTLSYSFHFKQRLFLDVLVLAGLYTHRVLTGSVAAQVTASPWLLAFSTFLFLSLALVKRYVELRSAQARQLEEIERRAYEVGDIDLVASMGLASGYIAVLVLCLFVSSDDVTALYRTPELLWLSCPLMLHWISRVWLLARRGQLHDDPVLFAATDPSSYVTGGLILALLVAATW